MAALRIGIVLSLATFSTAYSESYIGRVVGVTDGDSITILAYGAPQRIRLAEIDAPEKGQPYGARSREALSSLVFGKTVTVAPSTVDRYGRTVAHIYVDRLNVSTAMVVQGAAWVYTAYANDPQLPHLQAIAKANKKGLWGLAEYEQIPPWEWRRGAMRSTAPDPVNRPYSCGSKRYCREMTSCDEARWYFKECRLTRLDGDGDGVPCESLCLQ